MKDDIIEIIEQYNYGNCSIEQAAKDIESLLKDQTDELRKTTQEN